MEWWNDGERRRQKTPVFDHLTSPSILLRAMHERLRMAQGLSEAEQTK